MADTRSLLLAIAARLDKRFPPHSFGEGEDYTTMAAVQTVSEAIKEVVRYADDDNLSEKET